MFGNGFCALDGDVLYLYKLAYRGKYFDASERLPSNGMTQSLISIGQ